MKMVNRTAILFLGLVFSVNAGSVDSDSNIELPKAVTDGEVSLEVTIEQRRSVRQFAKQSLSLTDVAQLLWAAQGETSRFGERAAPSAGARYPLELYLVAGHVKALPAGVYRYLPERHSLQRIMEGDLRKSLAAAALGQSWVRDAPAILVLTGVYKRTMGKYGQRGRRYVHMEVGHAAQNVYLQAAARDLGTVMVGAFDDQEVSKVLGLPVDHEALGLMPVGHKQ